MSLSEKLLSAEESAARAGVSVETILMFERCGLLEPVVSEGKKLYQELDIRTVFYSRLKQQEQAAGKSVAGPPEEAPKANSTPEGDALSAAATTYSDAFASPRPESLEALSGITSEELHPANPTTPPAAPEPLAERPARTDAAKRSDAVSQTDSFGPESSLQTESPKTSVPESDPLLPSSNQLIEVNKGLREQIQVLRDERDWLRSRVENLENRSEREQMLLLSESETIRRLVTSPDRKRGFWQRALPWFGKE